ncbi:F-box-like protein [Medicago truncatula]|uniref:F-box-like protein n=1 Tax=Medicago truncatula TaxID=3880 RepID=A0A072V579_MEDTR|nr:F-box-like protein [Medicago truncatula]
MAVDRLPPEILAKILFRLPVKSLLRFGSTSKSLKSLIDSHNFINLHLKNNSINISQTSPPPFHSTTLSRVTAPTFLLSVHVTASSPSPMAKSLSGILTPPTKSQSGTITSVNITLSLSSLFLSLTFSDLSTLTAVYAFTASTLQFEARALHLWRKATSADHRGLKEEEGKNRFGPAKRKREEPIYFRIQARESTNRTNNQVFRRSCSKSPVKNHSLFISGGGAATLGWPATAPEEQASPEKMKTHLPP